MCKTDEKLIDETPILQPKSNRIQCNISIPKSIYFMKCLYQIAIPASQLGDTFNISSCQAQSSQLKRPTNLTPQSEKNI